MRSWFKFLLPLTLLLAAIILILGFYSSRTSKNLVVRYKDSLPKFSQNKIDQINITDKKGQLTLTRTTQGWELSAGKADESKVSQILDAVLDKDNSNYDLISQKLERAEEFGVASPSIKMVKLFSAENLVLSLLIGNDNYPGTFIRIEGQPEVYLSPQLLGSLITSDPKYFLEKPKISK